MKLNFSTINRVVGGISVTDIPRLNVTARDLGKEGITWTPQGEATQVLDVMAGMVNSPNLFQHIQMTVPLVKTTQVYADYLAQIESNSVIGKVTFKDDTGREHTLYNGAIQNVGAISSGGNAAEVVFTISGVFEINKDIL